MKKELHGIPVSKASAIISMEWKNVKASEKNMNKYKDLYEEEKRRHEEVLQRYQEDHMDKMEIINLHKRCNKKARKTPQPKKAPFKSDEPKKAPKSPEFIDDPNEKEQKSKKESRTVTKARKMLKRPRTRKKHQIHLNLLIQSGKKKKNDHPRMIKSLL